MAFGNMSVIQNGTGILVDGEWIRICSRNFSNAHVKNITAMDIFSGPFIYSLGLAGVLLDIIAVLVLANQRPRTSTSFILTALSLSDAFEIFGLLHSGNSAPLSNVFTKFIYKFPLNPYTQYAWSILRWTHGLTQAAISFNRGILVILATERWIAVCHPLKAASLCTRKRAIQAVVSWAIIAVFINLSRFFEWEVSECFDMGQDCKRWDLQYAMGRNYKLLVATIGSILINAIIPFIVLLVMNIMIVRSLLKSTNVHENATSQHARQKQESARRNITIMSIVICCLFLLLMIPWIAIRIYMTIRGEQLQQLRKERGYLLNSDLPNLWFIHSLSLFLVLNNSLNFVIYCCMSTRFRNSFKRTFGLQNFCKQWRRPENPSDRTGGTSLITRDTILTRYDYFKRPADNPGETVGHANGESLKRDDSLPRGDSLSRGNNVQRGESLQMERLNPTQGDQVSEDSHDLYLQNNSAT